ncbi:MAG: hypothetical protein LBC69_02840, partial [Eubacteriaceae bacterium]|nr:hypothetical protein [Eubacteriaceae bacterium]
MALDDLIHWYPAEQGLLKAKVTEEFEDSDNPGTIEVVVVKKLKNKSIGNPVGKSWRTYNVIESNS